MKMEGSSQVLLIKGILLRIHPLGTFNFYFLLLTRSNFLFETRLRVNLFSRSDYSFCCYFRRWLRIITVLQVITSNGQHKCLKRCGLKQERNIILRCTSTSSVDHGKISVDVLSWFTYTINAHLLLCRKIPIGIPQKAIQIVSRLERR